jgi:hypothetical protein
MFRNAKLLYSLIQMYKKKKKKGEMGENVYITACYPPLLNYSNYSNGACSLLYI